MKPSTSNMSVVEKQDVDTDNSIWINVFVIILSCGVRYPSWCMVEGFQGAASSFPTTCHGCVSSREPRRHPWSLHAANDYDDQIRKMLEETWDTSMMGKVPANPESAAEEAYDAILSAAGGRQGADGSFVETDDLTGVFFVNLFLPAYDITQNVEGVGKLYDEVKAVEYCISLAECFKGKTQILVRDDKTVETVTKVLDFRGKRESVSDGDVVFGGNDGDVVFGAGNSVSIEKVIPEGNEEESSSSDSDADEMRKKLLASWNSEAPVEDGINVPSSSKSSESSLPYRISSLLGKGEISMNQDMLEQVAKAVKENALPEEDEDNIIILSAVGNDELYAVRTLVQAYRTKKKIILVNCQFKMMPMELSDNETAYSMLPLVGRKRENPNTAGADDSPPPKIVVLRKHPGDWQIFVDAGIGYELADTYRAFMGQGPDMEYIARTVESHLDFVSRR